MSNVDFIGGHESWWPVELCQAISFSWFRNGHSVMGVRCILKAGHYPETVHQTATGNTWKDDVKKQEQIAVIATSQRSGKAYIKALGLENCEVFTDERHLEGRRIKGVIITPGYLDWMLNRAFTPMEIINAANIHADGLNAPRG